MGIVAVLLVLLLATTGCSSLLGGKWVAKVNGQNVSLDDYNARVTKAEDAYKTQGMDFSSQQGQQALPQLKSQILNGMIDATLVGQEVKRLGLKTDDPKVKAQEDAMKKQFGDPTKFQNALAMQGMTEQELQNFLALYINVTSGVKVSDSQVQAYFNSNKDKYGQPEEVEASHILVKTEAEAQDIIKQLQKGANFATLAKEKSIDTGTKQNGGELGWFTKDKMVPEFANAAFSQKVGTFSTTPVHTQYGWHVILVEGHKPAVAPDFNKVKAQVEQDALNQAQSDKFNTYMNNLKSKAGIQYANGYKPAS